MGLEPKVYKNFITEEERLHLHQYATTLFGQGKFHPNVNPRRFFLTLKRNPKIDSNGMYYTKEVHALVERITKTLSLTNAVVDPVIGFIISYMEPKAFIHKHKDLYHSEKFTDKINYRFNIMVERGSGETYDPIIDGVYYNIAKGDAWSFNATMCAHETLPIVGPEPRIVYQFGFLVDKV